MEHGHVQSFMNCQWLFSPYNSKNRMAHKTCNIYFPALNRKNMPFALVLYLRGLFSSLFWSKYEAYMDISWLLNFQYCNFNSYYRNWEFFSLTLSAFLPIPLYTHCSLSICLNQYSVFIPLWLHKYLFLSQLIQCDCFHALKISFWS